MKIGLFGGSFDPPHRAHFDIAKQALIQFQLDSVIWIPAALSPFKKKSDFLVSAEQRLQMVKITAASEPKFSVSDFEIQKGGVSYSIDTLRYFQKENPCADFFWIMGADAFEKISDWHESETLIRDLTFLVAGRGGITLKQTANCKAHRIQFKEDLIASSELKKNISEDRGWENLLPVVAEYIRKEHLYGVGQT